jgi:hypothetical protein
LLISSFFIHLLLPGCSVVSDSGTFGRPLSGLRSLVIPFSVPPLIPLFKPSLDQVSAPPSLIPRCVGPLSSFSLERCLAMVSTCLWASVCASGLVHVLSICLRAARRALSESGVIVF